MNFFACTDDTYCWLIWLCKSLHCNIFIMFVCFMTCSTSYCLVTASRIHGMYVCMYVRKWGYPKFREFVRNNMNTLSPNFHRHLQSSHLGLLYIDPIDFAIFGSTYWSLPALACLVPVAILLASLQWIRNAALWTGVSF